MTDHETAPPAAGPTTAEGMAAEIALHLPALTGFCQRCLGTWPCLARRLATLTEQNERFCWTLSDGLMKAADDLALSHQTVEEAAELLQNEILEDDVAVDALVLNAIKRVVGKLAASEEEAARLRARFLDFLPDPDRLVVLAEWLNLKYPEEEGKREVQQDLMHWAFKARAAHEIFAAPAPPAEAAMADHPWTFELDRYIDGDPLCDILGCMLTIGQHPPAETAEQGPASRRPVLRRPVVIERDDDYQFGSGGPEPELVAPPEPTIVPPAPAPAAEEA